MKIILKFYSQMPIFNMGNMVFKKGDIMIDEISNVLPRQVIAPTNNVFDKNSGNEAFGKSDQKAVGTTTKNVIENGKLIVEQYDRHGKLIRKTPPGYLPPGEKI